MSQSAARTYARIAGTGSYLPAQVLTNGDLAARGVETSDEWIASRTGIRQRHIAAEGETTSDLGYQAALRAMEAAGVDAKELDLIVVGTTTPDLIFPSTACLIQHRLGADGCPAFDVNAACSGFVYALTVADKFIRSGSHKNVLVIGTEVFSRILDFNDRTTCVLFGDGAGAVVLTASDEQLIDCMGFMATRMKLLVEPTGCLGFAAARQRAADFKGKRIGVLVSGGNVDLARFCSLLSH